MIIIACRLFSSSFKIGVRHLSLNIECLFSRSLIKANGPDVYPHIQGLITNDVNYLNVQDSLYAMFLNNKGRIMYDTIIYKTQDKDTLLLECDTNIQNDLIDYLKLFRIRRKVNIESSNSKIWVVNNDEDKKLNKKHIIDQFSQDMCYKDPRTDLLGFRIITTDDTNLYEKDDKKEPNYKILRYKLGIAEGVDELQSGINFPLEANCDYLKGVSFEKGCYIGQELTARVHHTGVIRKRFMPIILDEIADSLPRDSVIETESGIVGKLKAIHGKYGICLLRVNEVRQAEWKIKVNGISGLTYTPEWWNRSMDVSNL